MKNMNKISKLMEQAMKDNKDYSQCSVVVDNYLVTVTIEKRE